MLRDKVQGLEFRFRFPGSGASDKFGGLGFRFRF
jgi:hypothetical protein